MKVLVYGAGKFGQITSEVFQRYPRSYSDVAVFNPQRAVSLGGEGVRVSLELNAEDPDIFVMSASAVPRTTRKFLAKSFSPIERFWDAERHYNLRLFQRLLPFLARKSWKLLVVQTNPVHEWVNALQVLFPERLILGFGTAFDDRRIRYLSAAMSPSEELKVLRTLRIIGGHGAAMALNSEMVSHDLFETAQWMSDNLSIMFINAPDAYAKKWWVNVGIEPLVRGLAGQRTKTHLIVPVAYGGTRAATGIEVSITGLEVRPILPKSLSAVDRSRFVSHLRQMRRDGEKLAKMLEAAPTKS